MVEGGGGDEEVGALVAKGGGEAAPTAGGGDVDAEQAVGECGEGALQPGRELAGEGGVLGQLPGDASFDLGNGDDAEIDVRWPLVLESGGWRGEGPGHHDPKTGRSGVRPHSAGSGQAPRKSGPGTPGWRRG